MISPILAQPFDDELRQRAFRLGVYRTLHALAVSIKSGLGTKALLNDLHAVLI